MDTKLTLSLNKAVILAAKKYAQSNKISLSKLIEAYLAALTAEQSDGGDVTPLVESLSGVVSIDESMKLRQEYTDYLDEKYT